MKRSQWTTITIASGLMLVGAVPSTLSSCASTEDGGPPAAAPSTLPESGPSDGGDADVFLDGGGDGSDADCVATTRVTCEEAAFCPVPTNVTGAYALTAVWGSGKDDVWAAGSAGTVVHWDGAAWKPTPPLGETGRPFKNTFRMVRGSGPNDVWVASATDMIFHTDGYKNGTATWVRAPDVAGGLGVTAPIYAAWAKNPDDIRLVGGSTAYEPPGQYLSSNQTLKKPSDAGIEWTRLEGTATLHGIWGSPDNLWMIADNSAYFDWYLYQWVYNDWQAGLTLHGTPKDGDYVWESIDSRANCVFRGISGTSANDIWIVGDGGTIRHFGANAKEWEVVASPTNKNLRAVWAVASNDVWAVGEEGTILHWDGTSWSPSLAAFPANRPNPHLYGIWGSGPDDIWIVGDGIALHSTGGAK